MSQQPHLSDATVAIVGLGLMGSSLGLALDERCTRRLGADTSVEAARRALELGAVDAIGDVADVVAEADLVVLAMPVGAILAGITDIASAMRPGAIITDLGSTKRSICSAFDQVDVASIGGHPMCGSEQSGPDAADAKLYEGATWVLCDTTGSSDQTRALVGELVVAAGADAYQLEREQHDRAVAQVSHLPYVVGHALVGVLAGANDAATGRLASSGFAGATRTVAGSVTMWDDILASNADHVRAAIDQMRAQLDELESRLDDPIARRDWLRAGSELHSLTRRPGPHG